MVSPDLLFQIAAERERRRVEAEVGGWESERERCRADIHYFADTWVWEYDPRLVGARDRDGRGLSPFFQVKLWPEQHVFLDWLNARLVHQEEGVCEKSRDQGVTYLCCIKAVHGWLFEDGFKATFGSRDEDCVDKIGDPDSIFEKLRVIVHRLPEQLLPEGFDRRRHDNAMKLINPKTGATISGEGGKDMGRSGRSTIFFLDEAAFVPNAERVEKALSGNTDVLIWISTVQGMGNRFAQKRHEGTLRPRQIITMHWRNDPRKTQAWADEKRSRNTVVFASEYDIDYTASVAGLVIPGAWVQAAIDAHIKLKFSDEGTWGAALDVADEGPDRNALVARRGVILEYADEWDELDTAKAARRACANLQALVGSTQIIQTQYDCIGIGAGVKAEINRLKEEGILPRNLRFVPWDAGAAVLRPEGRVVEGDPDSPMNKDFYANLKAQGWWQLRGRFERTYRAVTEGERYDPEDLISLPSTLPALAQIVTELSQPTYGQSGRLRLLINKKPDGAKSPNYGDAVMMCYWPAGFGLFEIDTATLRRAKTATPGLGVRRR